MTDRDRLIELFNAIEKDPAITCPAYNTDKTCKDCKYTINESMCNYIERQVDYLLANGVILPPCKVGDKVYKITRNKVKECEVVFIGISADEKCSYFNFVENYADGTFKQSYSMVFEVIGKTVFLTKEKAEEKLKELNKGE